MQNNIIQYAISGALLLGTIASLGEPSDSKPSAAITTRVETYLDGREINAAILIGRNNHRVLAKGYGMANFELAVPITTTTKFRIGSITKQFTSMAIMILQEQGKLKVQDTVDVHLDDVPSHWRKLTLHQLLTHTSGLMHSWSLPGFADTMMVPRSLVETLDRFHAEPLLSEPGTKFSYSGVGYFVLAHIIEEVSGQPYEEFLSTEIFSRIGMLNSGADHPRSVLSNRASGYEYRDDNRENASYLHMPILTGGGNLYSTVDDLGRWCTALSNGELVSEASYAQMFKPELQNYAYGWGVFTTESHVLVHGHAGGVPGFNAFIAKAPEHQVCVVVLSNDGKTNSSEIGLKILDMVVES